MRKTHPMATLAAASAILLFGSARAQDAKTTDLAAYAGHYELAPGVDLVITYEMGHLYAQLTGQEKAEVFADGPKAIRWKIVEAKATFETSPDGHITGLVIHQNGADVPARKTD